MNSRFRKLAVFAGAAVLAGGVGVAVASQGDGRSGAQAALTQPGAVAGQNGQNGRSQSGQDSRSGGVPGLGAMPGGPPGSGGPGGTDLAALADALGVTTGQLRAAFLDLQPPAPGQTTLVAALADALGLPESEVEAALEAARPSGAPSDGAAPPAGAAARGDGSTPPSDPGQGDTTDATLT
jgi:hypothetical protein